MLFEGLVSNALLATVLAGFVALITRWCRRPPVVYWLWMLVYLKLVTPPVIHVPLPVHEYAPDTAVNVEQSPHQDLPHHGDTPVPVDTASATGLARATGAIAPGASRARRGGLGHWTTLVKFVWIAGSTMWGLVTAIRIARFGRLLAYSAAAPEGLQQEAVRLAQRFGLRRCPKVRIVNGCVPPLLWPRIMGRPLVLLPSQLLERLRPEQRSTLLAHELAHAYRGDHWVRWMEMLVLAVYWWHPVAWWSRRKLHEAEEQCCDAWVVWTFPDRAQSYANALAHTVDFLSSGRSAAPIMASGAGQVRFLERRIAMICSGIGHRRLSWPSRGAIILVGALSLPWAARAAEEPGTSSFDEGTVVTQVTSDATGVPSDEPSQPANSGATDAPPTRSTVWPSNRQITVWRLENADAAATARVLVTLFEKDGVRVAADERTNSVIGMGPEDVLAAMRTLILRLDATQSVKRPKTSAKGTHDPEPGATKVSRGPQVIVLRGNMDDVKGLTRILTELGLDAKESAAPSYPATADLGPVQIEAIESGATDGADVVVLRGRKEDVQKVQRVIAKLESDGQDKASSAKPHARTVQIETVDGTDTIVLKGDKDDVQRIEQILSKLHAGGNGEAATSSAKKSSRGGSQSNADKIPLEKGANTGRRL